jgi:hypothetical protein
LAHWCGRPIGNSEQTVNGAMGGDHTPVMPGRYTRSIPGRQPRHYSSEATVHVKPSLADLCFCLFAIGLVLLSFALMLVAGR